MRIVLIIRAQCREVPKKYCFDNGRTQTHPALKQLSK